MTRDEAVAVVQQTLGFRGDQSANIVAMLKLAQTTLEKNPTKPWFLLSEGSTIRTTVSERRVRVPADFLMEYELGTLEYVPDDTTRDEVDLVKYPREQLQLEYLSTDVGEPAYYSKDGYYFNIWPLPDDDYLLRMRYYKKGTVLDTNIENEWLLEVPLLLIGEAGMLLAPGLRDANATATFTNWARQGKLQLFGHNEELKHSNMRYQLGGKH